jgi:sacsin
MERNKLIIPDKESRLRPFSKVFYNDIGENYRLVNSEGCFIAHQSVDESLVKKLTLGRLGLKFEDFQDVGPNMGQAPITTVRNTLKQYTIKQFLLEFLANADDAKATEFNVAINLTTVHQAQNLRVLSPDMAYLCKLPSLVVHNNAEFTPQDFKGICSTSVGGKEGRPDTIGEFGQGVLTMFHLTDVCCDCFLLMHDLNPLTVGNGYFRFSCCLHGSLEEPPSTPCIPYSASATYTAVSS